MSKYIDYATKLIHYCENREMDKLKALIAEAEEYFLVTKEYEKIIRLHLEIHSQMEYIGEVDYIIEYLVRFTAFYEDLNIDKGRDHYLSTQGYLNMLLCEYQKALEFAELAFIEATKNNNPISKTVLQNNIAMLYIKLEDFDEALNRVGKAEELIEKYGFQDWYFQGSLLFSQAEAYIMLGRFEEAKSALEAIPETETFQLSVIQKMEYNHVMGIYYYYREEYEKALEYYRSAISVAEQKNVFYEFKKMYLGIAKVLFKLEYIEESDIYKEKADEITKETISQANRSVVQKAKLVIEFDEKIKEAKRLQEYEDNDNRLNTDKYDELTELLNKTYLFNQLNESFKNTKDKDLPKLLLIEITNISNIMSETAPVYGDKYIYEVSKLLKTNCEFTIGRIDVNKFVIVFSSVDKAEIEDEIKWLRTNLDESIIKIKDNNYKVEYKTDFIDLERISKDKKLPILDMYTII